MCFTYLARRFGVDTGNWLEHATAQRPYGTLRLMSIPKTCNLLPVLGNKDYEA